MVPGSVAVWLTIAGTPPLIVYPVTVPLPAFAPKKNWPALVTQRLARSMVSSQAVAEEAVQDAWLGVVRGIERFEGRSSIKTWLFRILVNRARSAGAREERNVPLDAEHAVDPARFDAGGQWAEPVERWRQEFDDRLESLGISGGNQRILHGPVSSNQCPNRDSKKCGQCIKRQQFPR